MLCVLFPTFSLGQSTEGLGMYPATREGVDCNYEKTFNAVTSKSFVYLFHFVASVVWVE